ncbi:MAG: tetratricopeptide repeat protein [Kofleriaceae bacterium]|nr:tetratricopeptide repeat protein [Myxococcales bacterium]MCB9572623.1 tetratricopeptide repeat protein [Kofleriaceae bacterium]
MTTKSFLKKLATAVAVASLACGVAACGGKSKAPMGSGLKKGDDVPPPPDVKKGAGADDQKKFTVDARKDFEAASAYFADQEKAGWNEAACRAAADKFSAVVREHKIVEAQYMVGRSYHACNLLKDAEAAYQQALQINNAHAPSISNLGELYWQVGKKADAQKYWESAIKADPKIVAARANLAMILLEQLRETKDKGTWERLEKQARDHLSSVLAVDNDHLKAYVLYGLVYMEGWEKNKNRLDLAKLLLDEATKRNDKYAPLQNAYGLWYMHKNNLTEALARFQQAVDLDGNYAEARMNVGLITLGFRKYDVAKDQFTKVLELTNNKSYDALIGLGIAQRGLGDLDGAEASYKRAKELDPKRGDAYYNLGVLYKDFLAAKKTDLRESQGAYRTAKDYFKEFLTKNDINPDDKDEAKGNMDDCDKVIKSLEDFIKASAAQPAAGG